MEVSKSRQKQTECAPVAAGKSRPRDELASAERACSHPHAKTTEHSPLASSQTAYVLALVVRLRTKGVLVLVLC